MFLDELYNSLDSGKWINIWQFREFNAKIFIKENRLFAFKGVADF